MLKIDRNKITMEEMLMLKESTTMIMPVDEICKMIGVDSTKYLKRNKKTGKESFDYNKFEKEVLDTSIEEIFENKVMWFYRWNNGKLYQRKDKDGRRANCYTVIYKKTQNKVEATEN